MIASPIITSAPSPPLEELELVDVAAGSEEVGVGVIEVDLMAVGMIGSAATVVGKSENPDALVEATSIEKMSDEHDSNTARPLSKSNFPHT